jgi:hypothetical protein
MESTDQNKPQVLKILRLSARIISILLILFCVFGAIVGAFILNPKVGSNYVPVKDYLIVFSIGIYIIGLLIAFKWELWGAIVSLLWLIPAIIFLVANNSGFAVIYIIVFVLIVPCILFLLSWIFHKEFKENQF